MNRRSYKGQGNPFWKGGYDTGCTQCGNKVHVKPSQAHRERHFCSKACTGEWASKNIAGENHWRFQGGTVDRVCEQCKEPFKQRLAEFNRNPGKYCNRQCLGIALRTRSEIPCKRCGKLFIAKQYKKDAKYCSCKCKKLAQIKERTVREVARLKLNKNITSLMHHCLRGTKKRQKWADLLGYTVENLMAHLEAKFQPGMTWENIGKWHVDHIRPRCSFSYESPTDKEFLECWAIGNLQPLWGVDNLRKGSRLDYKAS